MNKKRNLNRLLGIVLVMTLLPSIVLAEDEDHERGERGNFISVKSSRGTDVAPVENAVYKKECGSCHMAYPPGFLPSGSWQKIISGLNDHFGDNASLPKEDADALLAYLTANAAEKSNYKRSVAIMGAIGSSTPLRISEISYIVRKHHELSRRHIQDNPKVKSLSNCGACHPNGEAGSFREGEVRIPGFRGWD